MTSVESGPLREWPLYGMLFHVQQTLMCIFACVQSCWVQAGPKIEFHSLFFFFFASRCKYATCGRSGDLRTRPGDSHGRPPEICTKQARRWCPKSKTNRFVNYCNKENCWKIHVFKYLYIHILICRASYVDNISWRSVVKQGWNNVRILMLGQRQFHNVEATLWKWGNFNFHLQPSHNHHPT